MKKHTTKNISTMKIPKVKDVDLNDYDEYESSIDFSSAKKVKVILDELFLAGEYAAFIEITNLYMDHIGKLKTKKEKRKK